MKILRYILFGFVLVSMIPANAQCELNSAETHVKEFYQWYIRGETNKSVYSDLSEYVDECVSRSLRIMYARAYFDCDYFTRAQDIADDWLDVMVVHKEMKVNDTTSVVPISFKFSENKQHHLLVFVRKEMDGWRIIKVSGTEDFYE